jgi:hypothetical protein
MTFTVIEERHQPTMKIALYEGDSLMTKDNTFLCTLCLDGVQPTDGFGREITVSIGVEENGVKAFTVMEHSSGVEAQARIMEDDVVCTQGRALTKAKEFQARRKTLTDLSKQLELQRCQQSAASSARPHTAGDLDVSREKRDVLNCQVATCIVPMPGKTKMPMPEQPSQATTAGSLASMLNSQSPMYDDDDDLDRTRAHVESQIVGDVNVIRDNLTHALDSQMLQSRLEVEFVPGRHPQIPTRILRKFHLVHPTAEKFSSLVPNLLQLTLSKTKT